MAAAAADEFGTVRVFLTTEVKTQKTEGSEHFGLLCGSNCVVSLLSGSSVQKFTQG